MFIKIWGTVLAFSLLLAAQNLVTPLFPIKDGEADQLTFSGIHEDFEVCGSNDRVVSWIAYDTRNIDVTSLKKATLTLFVKSVINTGTMKVYRLLEPMDTSESAVSYFQIRYDAAQVLSTVPIRNTDVEKIVRIEVTSAVKNPPFYGLVFFSDDGLLATFGSKESSIKPIIELEYGINPEQYRGIGGLSWWVFQDAKGSSAVFDTVRFDKVQATLKIPVNGTACYAGCGVAFHAMHCAMSIKDYNKMVMNMMIPHNQKVVVQLLQTSITDGDYHSKEIQGTGEALYSLSLLDFRQRGSGVAKPLDLENIWGIHIINEKNNTAISVSIKNILFSH